MEKKFKNTTIRLYRGDITEMMVDAIVNAANKKLQHGGGVARAIVKKGGHIIQDESNKIGEIEVGKAIITTAGKLKAKYVIHAVGPQMGEGEEDEKLKNATLNSLMLADEYNVKSIAFPAISTGAFGYPKDKCAKIMIQTAIDYSNMDTEIKTIIFNLIDDRTYDIFQKELNSY
ncbi:MAG: macro domain-containing protein [Methanocellales archaeon]|nr:macro domain-containing protein [Methanocellales archaeon]MDD3421124.1 macro domain-containing protein [Methanocellales archaeon]MDD4898194.1 macro domain-containing protein [Methanocellales archaeon]MDD5446993.1 macro domain-containing protein [Methanocellales archaeon]